MKAHSVVLLCALVLLAPSAWSQEPLDMSSINAVDSLAQDLRARVAYIRVVPRQAAGQPKAWEEVVTGYAVPWGDRRLVTAAHLVQDAERISVVTPGGDMTAKIVLWDIERRVAILETSRPLRTFGKMIIPARVAAKERKVDMEVVALVSTSALSGAMTSVVTHVGTEPGLEGHPRTGLELNAAMPVFDRGLRLVGLTRRNAFDHDKFMLIPPEMIIAAQTATRAPSGVEPEKSAHPWWSK